MEFMLQQNLALRQQLCMKLELKSEFLDSVLVRTETLLKEDGQARDAIALIKHIRSEEDYRGVIDWLLAVFIPSMKAHILSFYEDEGPRLIQGWKWRYIDYVDRMMVLALKDLVTFRKEMRMQGWGHGKAGGHSLQVIELTAAHVDLVWGPQFPICPQPVEEVREVA